MAWAEQSTGVSGLGACRPVVQDVVQLLCVLFLGASVRRTDQARVYEAAVRLHPVGVDPWRIRLKNQKTLQPGWPND